MDRRVLIVQHGQKVPEPGDPGLTARGREQAEAVANWLATGPRPATLWASPLRRARETAAPIVERFGLELVIDERLRERMNWDTADGQTAEDFFADWQRTVADRSYRPAVGDSSLDAAERFLAALDSLDETAPTGLAVVVGHGGVTVDVLRTLLGDDALPPGLITDGVPNGSVTILQRQGGLWAVEALPRPVAPAR